MQIKRTKQKNTESTGHMKKVCIFRFKFQAVLFGVKTYFKAISLVLLYINMMFFSSSTLYFVVFFGWFLLGGPPWFRPVRCLTLVVLDYRHLGTAPLRNTPWKINMEPENDGLEDDFLFSKIGWFLGSMLIFRGLKGFWSGSFFYGTPMEDQN